MELYELPISNTDKLMAIADAACIPLGGTFELIPLCNMNCNMCYIKHSKHEMDEEGRMLDLEEWIRIAEEAKDAGVLTVLLTGGEPLLYPKFRELYIALMHMGMYVSINTNGTLIDETWADLFAQYVPRAVNITLYGMSDATYNCLCHNPTGYTQVMHAISLLQERNIPFKINCSVTPENIMDYPEIQEFTRKNCLILQPTTYLFPPARKNGSLEQFCRISPEQVALLQLNTSEFIKNSPDYHQRIKNTLNLLNQTIKSEQNGYHCKAGRSGFWINWKGEMTSCGMIPLKPQDLTQINFSDAWKNIVKLQAELPLCEKCQNCRKRNLCYACPAASYTETGDLTKVPEYLCKVTDAKIQYLINELGEEERKEFLYLLESEIE